MKRVIKYIIAPLLVFCIILPLARAYLRNQIKERTKITTPNGIESLEKVTLGGVEQWILIREQDRSNPVMLFLHGGPGQPYIFRAREIGVDLKLEQHFVMVYWDQRGQGKSYSPDIPPQSMTIEQFVSDIRELTEMLKRRFHVLQIYLMGRSWGTIIGTLAAARYPGLFYAYIGVGQFVDAIEGERISYQFALDQAIRSGNKKALRELKEIGPPPYDDYRKNLLKGKWIDEFGGVQYGRKDKYELFKKIKKALLSPEMSLRDIFRILSNLYFSIELLWDDIMKVDLFEQAPQIDAPVYLLAGRHDYLTPAELVERYYQKLEAPKGKEIIWFENSAHIVMFEEPEKFYDVMVNKILKETYKN